MFMRLCAAALLICGIATNAAQADYRLISTQFEEPTRITASENPVSLKVAGWGDAWAQTVWMARQKGGGSLFYTVSIINRDGYTGDLFFQAGAPDTFFRDDTLRAQVQRHRLFSKGEVEFGAYDTVDNGAAEYRYILFSWKNEGVTRSCSFFLSAWRNYVSQGHLCAGPERPTLTEATVRSYIKAITFQKELAAAGEATLPK
jgi:hypothetical protein